MTNKMFRIIGYVVGILFILMCALVWIKTNSPGFFLWGVIVLAVLLWQLSIHIREYVHFRRQLKRSRTPQLDNTSKEP